MYSQDKTLIDRRELLKIKLATLVFETGAIRDAEAKQLRYGRKVALPEPFLYAEMHDHRVKVVRHEARLTGLALGFIRGKTLPELEPYVKHVLLDSQWGAIKSMVKKYGNNKALLHAGEQYRLYFAKSYGTKPAHVFRTKMPFDKRTIGCKAVPVTE